LDLRSFSLHHLLLTGALLLAPSVSFAESGYLLTVIDVSNGSNSEVLDVLAQIREAFEEHPQVQQRELHRMLDAGAHDDHYGNIESAKKSFEDGRTAFDRGRYEEAMANLENTALFLNSSFGFLKSATLYIDTMLYLAAGQLEVANTGTSSGEGISEEDVFATLEQLLIKYPKLLYPNQRFNQEFNQYLERVRGQVSRRGKGDLRIETADGSPAATYVDGIYRGISPLTIFSLVEGNHFVRIVSQGKAVGQQVAAIDTDARASVTVSVVPARNGKLLEEIVGRLREDLRRSEGAPQHIHELKGLLHTDYVVLVNGNAAAYGTEVHAALFNLMSGARIRSTRVVFGRGGPRRPAATVANRLLKIEEPKPLTTIASQGSGSDSVFNQWWFWTATAGLIGGGILTAVILAQDEGGATGLPRKPDTGTLLVRF